MVSMGQAAVGRESEGQSLSLLSASLESLKIALGEMGVNERERERR